MIRINLLPKEERARTAPRLRLPKMGAMVPLVGVAAVLGIVTVIAVLEHAKVAALNKDVVELRDEVRAIQPQVDRVRKLTTQREELERRLDIIRQLDQGRFLCVRMMDDVSRNTPNYMWLTDIRQSTPRSISITGITFSNLIVADFMMRLEQSSMFANIGLTQTKRGKIEERDVMEFAITADLTPGDLPTDFKAEALIQDLIQEEN